MNAVIEIQDVWQSFRQGFWLKRAEVLKGISFNVPQGCIFGVLGPNGAGKTTLFHLIVGLRRPTRGQVLLQGRPAIEAGARKLMGYVPERPYFHGFLTPRELLGFLGGLSGMTRAAMNKRIPEVLELVGMGHAMDRELSRCSKGMTQRVGIAQAILHDPQVLVLDEPMSGLDPRGRREMRELFLKLSQLGKTVFFSSHLTSDIEELCSHLAVIQQGRLSGAGELNDFLTDTGLYEIRVTAKTPAQEQEMISRFGQPLRTQGGLVLRIRKEKVSEVLQYCVRDSIQVETVGPVYKPLEEFFIPDARRDRA